MEMIVTPKFSSKEYELNLQKFWFEFQDVAFELGKTLTIYMQEFINTRCNRRGNTGNLANTITFEGNITAPARIEWGIGNITLLNAKAKYWYVINYGKTVSGQNFIPNKGKFVPGSFEGNAPESALRQGVNKFNYKDGSGMGIIPKSVVRPLNYIQATRTKLNSELVTLINSLKKGL